MSLQIAIWEPRSGLVLNKIRGHEDAVSSVQFYPFLSNKSVPLLFSVGDCTCRIWHPLRKRNKQLLSLRQHKPGHEVSIVICWILMVFIKRSCSRYHFFDSRYRYSSVKLVKLPIFVFLVICLVIA